MRVGVFYVQLGILSLFCMFLGGNSDKNLNSFITDIIKKFRLISPTIIYDGEVPQICVTRPWVLCLDQENEQNILLEEEKDRGMSKIFWLLSPSYSLHFISSHINPLYSFFLLVENCFIASGPNAGMKCVLPFTLLQKTYNDCTTDWGLGNNGKPWCSTKGSMRLPDIPGGHYGDCGQECPIKKSN